MTRPPHEETPWSDSALQQSNISGRAAFASAMADRIDQIGVGHPSTVFGLIGPWGSGKTTLLHEVSKQLPAWKAVWFSPWSASDIEAITSEFIATLAGAFSEKDIKRKLLDYARFGTPALKLIPVVGDMASDAVAQHLSKLAEKPPWYDEFQRVSESIAEQNTRVMVFVDDVDRLDVIELRSLLKVVRLLGRFTNVHYLMAYDESTIEGTLGPGGARGYMEKIVQHPFEVPPPPQVVRRQWARSILDAADPPSEEMNPPYIQQREEYIRILAAGLQTPRASERLKEQVISLHALAENAEIDILDFVALTWLRISHHSAWEHIRQQPGVYLSMQNEKPDQKAKKLGNVDSLVEKDFAEPVKDAISLLFEPSTGSEVVADRRWRLHKPRYFERYFHVGLAEDDVSERSAENAIRDLQRGTDSSVDISTLRSIILGADQERSLLALSTAWELRTYATGTSSALLNFVQKIRIALTPTEGNVSIAIPAADRWVDREIRLALFSEHSSIEALVQTFGYSTLLASAFVARRETRDNPERTRKLYSGMARMWLEEVSNEELDSLLGRNELTRMTGFVEWVSGDRDHRGFLARYADDPDILLKIAESYVSFGAWYGNGATYEAIFNSDEFEYAIGGKPSPQIIDNMTLPAPVNDYEFDELDADLLTGAQKSDFTLKRLRATYSAPPAENSEF